jgi:hypothetical protein
MRTMDAAEPRRFMETAYPRALRAAQRAFKRWPRRKREDAIAEMVGRVWMTWVLNMEKGKGPLGLLGPNIHWAILWVRYDRKIAGRARGFHVSDDRPNRKRQQLLVIEATVALRASVRRRRRAQGGSPTLRSTGPTCAALQPPNATAQARKRRASFFRFKIAVLIPIATPFSFRKQSLD